MVTGGSAVSALVKEVIVIAAIEAAGRKSGEAPVTYGADKSRVSMVNCDVDTSETCWWSCNK